MTRRLRFGLLSFFLGAAGFTCAGIRCPPVPIPSEARGSWSVPGGPKVSIEGSVRTHRGFGAIPVKARRGFVTFARTLECPLVR